jgi:magnesium chelatase family protein
LRPDVVEAVCILGDQCLSLLEQAVDKFNLSARSYQRILRVARTIADLQGAETITPPHIAEALSLRTLDRR